MAEVRDIGSGPSRARARSFKLEETQKMVDQIQLQVDKINSALASGVISQPVNRPKSHTINSVARNQIPPLSHSSPALQRSQYPSLALGPIAEVKSNDSKDNVPDIFPSTSSPNRKRAQTSGASTLSKVSGTIRNLLSPSVPTTPRYERHLALSYEQIEWVNSKSEKFEVSYGTLAQQQIITEIIETEITYNGLLSNLVEIASSFKEEPSQVLDNLEFPSILDKVLFTIKDMPIIDASKCENRLTMFFDDFRKYNTVSNSLLKKMKAAKDIKSFAQAFREVDLFELRTASVNKSRFLSLDETLRKSILKAFQKTHQDYLLNPEEGTKQEFETLTIIPIQRVTRYELLFKGLFNNSSDSDKAILKDVLEMVVKLSETLDKYKQGYDALVKLDSHVEDLPLS